MLQVGDTAAGLAASLAPAFVAVFVVAAVPVERAPAGIDSAGETSSASRRLRVIARIDEGEEAKDTWHGVPEHLPEVGRERGKRAGWR